MISILDIARNMRAMGEMLIEQSKELEAFGLALAPLFNIQPSPITPQPIKPSVTNGAALELVQEELSALPEHLRTEKQRVALSATNSTSLQPTDTIMNRTSRLIEKPMALSQILSVRQ